MKHSIENTFDLFFVVEFAKTGLERNRYRFACGPKLKSHLITNGIKHSRKAETVPRYRSSSSNNYNHTNFVRKK